MYLEFEIFLIICNYLGTIAFAASGALKGIKYKLDIFGMTLLATMTACGGGIIRDILLNEVPTALINPEGLYISIITTVTLYIFMKKFRKSIKKSKRRNGKRYRLIHISNLIFDSLGLSAFAIIGADKGIGLNQNLITTAILATLTGAGGGVIRDMLVSEVPAVLREDIYAVLAFGTGMLYHIMIKNLHFMKISTTIFLFTASLCIRLLIIKYKINLPGANKKV